MKKIIFIIGILSLLMLIGCETEEKKTIQTTYIGGQSGLIASFIEGAPPSEIFDNNQYPFGIAIKLENKGEFDIAVDAGYVEMLGFNPTDLGTTQANLKKNIGLMKGTKKNFDGSVLNGDSTVIEFNDLNYAVNLPGDLDLKVRANTCYDYATKVSTKICVKKDLLSTSKAICEISGEKDVANSGAPIHITSFKENPIGSNKLQFTFVIEKVGETNDRFFKKSTDCLDTATNMNKNIIHVKITSGVGGISPSCTGFREGSGSEGDVMLYDGAPRTVTCTVDTTNVQGEFEDFMNIELGYRYMQFIEKSIVIKDVSTS